VTFSPSDKLFREACAAFDILCEGQKALGVAVSGGSDSTALLMLAAEWGRVGKVRIEAVTVDHGLRPEAREEARDVARLAAGFGVAHTTLTWERGDSAKTVGQAEAREARHSLLATWALEKSIGVIALGHTQDDRVETFLMRARAGSGWRGLSGPLPSGPSPVWPEGRALRLVRPLLAFGREELREALRRRNLPWVDDPSNEATRFERVRMRQLVRRMEGETLVRAVRVMDGLAGMRAASLAQAREGLAVVRFTANESEMSLEALRALGSEAQARLVEALVMAAGGAAQPPRSEALGRIAQRLGRGHLGLTLGGAWLRSDGSTLRISRAPPRQGEALGADPAWERARALLADPRAEALRVRGNAEPIHRPNPPSGEKDAGK
jgi:tRNA(Ile)-lysidine synthase